MLDWLLAALGLVPSGINARVTPGAVQGWVVSQPVHQITPATPLPDPIERLAVDDSVGPDAKVCGVLKPPQPSDDGDPGFLDDLGGRLWLPGPPIGVSDESRVPALGQCLQSGGAAALGLDDQPLPQDFVWTA